MTFLLNVNSRTVHNADSKDKRCRIQQIQDGNKKLFQTYQEAKEYLPKGKRNTAPCSFCLGVNYGKEQGKTNEKIYYSDSDRTDYRGFLCL